MVLLPSCSEKDYLDYLLERWKRKAKRTKEAFRRGVLKWDCLSESN